MVSEILASMVDLPDSSSLEATCHFGFVAHTRGARVKTKEWWEDVSVNMSEAVTWWSMDSAHTHTSLGRKAVRMLL